MEEEAKPELCQELQSLEKGQLSLTQDSLTPNAVPFWLHHNEQTEERIGRGKMNESI